MTLSEFAQYLVLSVCALALSWADVMPRRVR